MEQKEAVNQSLWRDNKNFKEENARLVGVKANLENELVAARTDFEKKLDHLKQ
jgi:hypothetical protein